MPLMIDTNVLLNSINENSPFYVECRKLVSEAIEDRQRLFLTWGIVYEFLRVSTHPRVFLTPLTAKSSRQFLEDFISAGEVEILSETERHFEIIGDILNTLKNSKGSIFHDIHTAALMKEHSIKRIATLDSDFQQFRFLEIVTPS